MRLYANRKSSLPASSAFPVGFGAQAPEGEGELVKVRREWRNAEEDRRDTMFTLKRSAHIC